MGFRKSIKKHCIDQLPNRYRLAAREHISITTTETHMLLGT